MHSDCIVASSSSSQRRRPSATINSEDGSASPTDAHFRPHAHDKRSDAATSGLAEVDGFDQPVPITPSSPSDHRFLSRSPSPQASSASPSPSKMKRPRDRGYAQISYSNVTSSPVSWKDAKTRNAHGRSYASNLRSHDQTFFQRQLQSLSSQLPIFHRRSAVSTYNTPEKAGRERLFQSYFSWANVTRIMRRVLQRQRKQFALMLGVLSLVLLFYITRELVLSPSRAVLVADMRAKLLVASIGTLHFWGAAASFSLFWQPIREAASWSGRGQENGPSKERACSTRSTMPALMATSSKSSTWPRRDDTPTNGARAGRKLTSCDGVSKTILTSNGKLSLICPDVNKH